MRKLQQDLNTEMSIVEILKQLRYFNLALYQTLSINDRTAILQQTEKGHILKPSSREPSYRNITDISKLSEARRYREDSSTLTQSIRGKRTARNLSSTVNQLQMDVLSSRDDSEKG